MNDRFDVVVIGGGTAGLVTASGCARLGRRVALVEKEALSGDWSCFLATFSVEFVSAAMRIRYCAVSPSSS